MSISEPFPAPLFVRQSARARRLRIVIKPDRVELVIPRGASERDALRFLDQNRPWVLSKLKEAASRAEKKPAVKPALLSKDSTVPFQGREIEVKVGRSGNTRLKAQMMPCGGLEILVPEGREPSEALIKASLFAIVRPWLEQETRRQIDRLGVPDGLRPRHVRIKQMRSRWGSCGPQGDINLNWILAFMPAPMLEYVIFHELCHLRHRNHSKAFWDLVATQVPDWPKRREWLRKEGGAWVLRFG